MTERLRPDPSSALAAFYRRVHRERMAGVPIVNPAIDVDAVGFAPWGPYWLGVMVTPWFINVVLAPREPSAPQPPAVGEKRLFALPAGEFEFIGAHAEGVGRFAMASLFSPVLEFEDHATARLVAVYAREALLKPEALEADRAPGASRRFEDSLGTPMSRAQFLHPGSAHDDRR